MVHSSSSQREGAKTLANRKNATKKNERSNIRQAREQQARRERATTQGRGNDRPPVAATAPLRPFDFRLEGLRGGGN